MVKIGDKFIANNGEKFLTESDCINYEKTVLATSLQGKMFDQDLKPVDNFQKAEYNKKYQKIKTDFMFLERS